MELNWSLWNAVESTVVPNLWSHHVLCSAIFMWNSQQNLFLIIWWYLSPSPFYYINEQKNLLKPKKLHLSAKFLFLDVMGYVISDWRSKKYYYCFHQDFDFIFKRECVGHDNTLSQINYFCCLTTILQPKYFFLVG